MPEEVAFIHRLGCRHGSAGWSIRQWRASWSSPPSPLASFNAGATLWSSLAIAIEAGILLALVCHVTHTLWACMSLHAAWNVAQGTIHGLAVSGSGGKVGCCPRTGPDWLSGGAFGAEASVAALLVCTSVSPGLLLIAWRRRIIVRSHRPRAATPSCEATPTA